MPRRFRRIGRFMLGKHSKRVRGQGASIGVSGNDVGTARRFRDREAEINRLSPIAGFAVFADDLLVSAAYDNEARNIVDLCADAFDSTQMIARLNLTGS